MLVLTRKPQEEFCFPNLGVQVRVLSVQGRRVRIGVEAPSDIAIVRSELPRAKEGMDRRAAEAQAKRRETEQQTEARHEFNNRLNSAKLGLHLASQQFAHKRYDAAEGALADAIQQLTLLEKHAAGDDQTPKKDQAEAGHQRVLLVEDDANESRLLAGILSLEGFEVVTAADGLEALERLTSERFDFVLVDMRMPRCDGPSTVQQIRDRSELSSMKVFSVSATNPEDLGLPIGDGGVDAWFPKPLDPAGMLRELKHRLHAAA